MTSSSPNAGQLEVLRMIEADGGCVELGGIDARCIPVRRWTTMQRFGWIDAEWCSPVLTTYKPGWWKLSLTDAGKAILDRKRK